MTDTAAVRDKQRIPRIVSVDDHVVEPPHVWQRWLPKRYRAQGPRVERGGFEMMQKDGAFLITRPSAPSAGGREVDWWVYEDEGYPIPMVMACAGYSEDKYTFEPIGFDAMRPGCYDPKARLADMDLNHTERSLCFPTFPRFCGQRFYEGKDKDLGIACVKAYNDWMIEEWCGDSGGRLIPLCIIPLWDPRAAAAEVRRNAARGCRAVTFSELPVNLGLPSIHDKSRYWDPFFEACDETGTVVCMHIGSGSKMPTSSPDAPPGVRFALTTHNAQLSMADWLLSGVLARFSRLKIAYSESQIGWMPFLLERVDNVFRKSYAWAELDPAITEPPSTYFPGRVFGCFFEDDFGVRVRDEVGLDSITFEIDYPHQDSTWPHSLAYLEKVTHDLTDEEIHRIVRGNALEMLGLDDVPLS
ncbi:amidohydrolase family protein [Streptomyces sp. NPDC050145]|uniref:amidohydrolase family protein n=1 Tax=Streptomyces sp. NPDC050145 TaxID=3365602 RepID=UPI0037B20045